MHLRCFHGINKTVIVIYFILFYGRPQIGINDRQTHYGFYWCCPIRVRLFFRVLQGRVLSCSQGCLGTHFVATRRGGELVKSGIYREWCRMLIAQAGQCSRRTWWAWVGRVPWPNRSTTPLKSNRERQSNQDDCNMSCFRPLRSMFWDRPHPPIGGNG